MRYFRISFVWMAAAGMAASLVIGQEPAAPQPGATNPPAAAKPAALVEPNEADDDKPKPLREQTIYIPYAKLKKTLSSKNTKIGSTP